MQPYARLNVNGRINKPLLWHLGGLAASLIHSLHLSPGKGALRSVTVTYLVHPTVQKSVLIWLSGSLQ